MVEKKYIALSALGGSLWGFSFLATTLAKQYGLEPVQIQTGRWTVAAAFFVVMILTGKVKLPEKSKGLVRLFLVAGVQSCLSMVLESYGIVMTSSSEASLFVAAMPSVALLIETIMFRRKKNVFTFLCIAVTLCGVLVCTIFAPGFSGEGNRLGYLLMASSVLAGATYTCLVSLVREEFEPIQITAAMALSGAVFFNLVNFAAGYGTQTYVILLSDFKIITCILFLGIICSAICYRIMNIVIAGIGPALAGNITAAFSTATGILSGILIAGDAWGWYTLVGLVLIFTGVSAVGKAK